jgi:lipoprotein-anchoring transpeptidase ErfK/SrfK
MRASGRRISIFDFANERFWQFAVLTAAGTVGASASANAALYYWNGDATYYGGQAEPVLVPHRHKARRNPARKDARVEKEAGTKPQGPLIINVSIEQQRVRVYDTNGLYAESPVSTGMKGHSTPMGVFSVIQKQKYHQSNIYSGAPMPYMQRITWSGIAMHAGVLPGYAASHGCIRMPMAFAVKMYGWTRMGARVIVTPGTISPENFSHPLLVTQRVMPQPVADDLPKADAPLGVKGDKGADKPETSLELRSTVGHVQQASLRDNTHTADASGAMPAASASATMSDAPSSVADKPEEASRDATRSEASAAKPDDAKPQAQAAADKPEIAATADKPAESKSTDAATSDSSAAADNKTIGETQVKARSDAAKTEVSASDHVKAEAKADEPKADEPKSDAAKSDTAKFDTAKPDVAGAGAPKVDVAKDAPDAAGNADKAADKPAEPAKAADAPDAKKDPARLPALAKTDMPKRTGQIAVYISRKDSKLYVRQNFAPLFESPVTIAASDRPLGTHVFTAEADKTDTNALHWSVVTLPTRNAARIDDENRTSRRHKMTGAAAVEAKPVVNSPAEALDRITIPADAMARITDMLGTGGSIIVSDLGVNQGETGEGTDFIVPLR